MRFLVKFVALCCVLPVSFTLSAQDNDSETVLEEIVTVGSQIKGASVTEALPVTVIDEEFMEAASATDTDDLFRYLPSQGNVAFGGKGIRSTRGGVNGSRGDVASINLRSVGTGNTLTLINGRRMVAHPTTQNDEPMQVPVTTYNLNSIPVAGMSRVDILRDGASPLYGSDAVAGVVNFVLDDDFEGVEASFNYGRSTGTDYDNKTLSLKAGHTFNNDQTNITFNGIYTDRGALTTEDRDYARSSDLRPFFVGTPFEGDSQLNNTITRSAWGQFRLPNSVTVNGESNRTFHIQPASMPGCVSTSVIGGTPDVCLDFGSRNDGIIYDENHPASGRTIIDPRTRMNLFGNFTHTFDNGGVLKGEVGYYRAELDNVRGRGNGPVGAYQIWVPETNYWNPFGAILLPDGSVNPNRIPGLDINEVPAEGLAYRLSGGGSSYNVLDGDQRKAYDKDEVWRFVLSHEGDFKGWDYDTGVVYSEATNLDIGLNRISNSAIQESLALATPDAYNPFNGGGAVGNGNVFDNNPSPQAALDSIFIDVEKLTRTTLFLADFKFSKPDLFSIWAGDIGFGGGFEYRKETYLDDRDPHLDGTVTYNNFNTGAELNSDVMNSSGTLDNGGDRKVYSGFGELLIPLISPDMDIPLVDSLDVQLAARWERFVDIDENVVKPRASMSWYLHPSFQIRASYTQGFRAPNLAQANNRVTTRSRPGTDYYYCEAGIRNGTYVDMAACDSDNNSTAVLGNEKAHGATRRDFGDKTLRSEESVSKSIGFTFQPEFIDGLLVTVDYWRIDQVDVIGFADVPEHSALDWALRINGMAPNPLVTRAAPTADNVAFFAGTGLTAVGEILSVDAKYQNLEKQKVAGVDFQLRYNMPTTAWGDFTFNVAAAKLITKESLLSDNGAFITAQGNTTVTNDGVAAGGSFVRRDRNPEWKGNASVHWNRNNWNASLAYQHIGSVEDTLISQDVTGDPLYVGSYDSINATLGYYFSSGRLEGTTATFGVKNIFDEEPELADESFGFMSEINTAEGRYVHFTLKYSFL